MFDIDNKVIKGAGKHKRNRQAQVQQKTKEQPLPPSASENIGNESPSSPPVDLIGVTSIINNNCDSFKSAIMVPESCPPSESSSVGVSGPVSHQGPLETSENASTSLRTENSAFPHSRLGSQPHAGESSVTSSQKAVSRADTHPDDTSRVSSSKETPNLRSTVDDPSQKAGGISLINSRKGNSDFNGSPWNSLASHMVKSPQSTHPSYNRDLGSPGLSDGQRWTSSGQLNSSVATKSKMQEFDIIADNDKASLLSGLDYSIVSGRKIQFGNVSGDSKAHKTTAPILRVSAAGETSPTSDDALVSLARAMREQAAVIHAMTGQSDEDELSRLAIEKRDLAQQVLMLQQEIENMGGSRQSSVASVLSRGSGRLSARSPRIQRRYSFGQLGNIPEVVTADEMTTLCSIGGLSVPGNMAIYRDSYRVRSLPTDDLTDNDMSMIPRFEGASVCIGGSRRSKYSRISNSSGPSWAVRKSLSRRSRTSKEGFEPNLPDFLRPESPPGSQLWRSLAFFTTFFIPDAIVPAPGAGAKQAWRYVVP